MDAFDNVNCRTEEELMAVCNILRLTQEWKIGFFRLPDSMGVESWTALKEVLGRGKAVCFDPGYCHTDGELKAMCDVLGHAQFWKKCKTWNYLALHLPTNMGADCWTALTKVVGRGELDLFDRVHCLNNKEVRAMCAVLGLVRKFTIMELYLPDNMDADSWTALTKVTGGWQRSVETFHVKGSALRTANERQVEALWGATDIGWKDDSCRITIALKSEGEPGLRKLLAFKNSISGT